MFEVLQLKPGNRLFVYSAFLFVNKSISSGQALTHLSQTMHNLWEILCCCLTFCITSISIGQAVEQALHDLQLSDLTGVILNNEKREKSPEIVINGQSNLQYERLPVKKVSMKPILIAT